MSCDLTERFLNLNPRPAIRVKTGDISAWTSNNTAELAIYINALVEAMLQIRKGQGGRKTSASHAAADNRTRHLGPSVKD
ncbi:MAG: hypothetical protein WCF03_10130 [Nitrososphaeraceae archaeon]